MRATEVQNPEQRVTKHAPLTPPPMLVARMQSLEMLPRANAITQQPTLCPIISMFVNRKNRFLIHAAMVITITPIKPTKCIRLSQLLQMPRHGRPIEPLCVHKIVQHARLVDIRQHVRDRTGLAGKELVATTGVNEGSIGNEVDQD